MAIGAAIVNTWKYGIWIVVVPSLWLFALGVFAAGVAPFFEWVSAHHERALLVAYERRIVQAAGDDKDAHEAAKKTADALEADRSAAAARTQITMFLSAILFSSGVAWPILILTLWLFHALPAELTFAYPGT